jgi:hypothetical protein
MDFTLIANLMHVKSVCEGHHTACDCALVDEYLLLRECLEAMQDAVCGLECDHNEENEGVHFCPCYCLQFSAIDRTIDRMAQIEATLHLK